MDGAGEGATIVLDENCTVSAQLFLHLHGSKLNMLSAGDVMGPRSVINWLYLQFFDVIIRTRLSTFLYKPLLGLLACHSVAAYCSSAWDM